MTPTSTSYTLPNELSGCDGTSNTCIQNTLNPSELNLWRVIRKNEDGTVDMVSEYVSSVEVYFYGKTGYINYIKALNEVAAQYTNEKYVARTRHIGYSNQTEVITDTSKLDQMSAPWTKSTSISNQWTGCDTNNYLCGEDESLGAGDIGYETDYNLVNNVYETMKGYTLDGLINRYFLASRRFFKQTDSHWKFSKRFVDNDGCLAALRLYISYEGDFNSNERGASIRPILTLKENVEIKSGDGKSDKTAYQLQ